MERLIHTFAARIRAVIPEVRNAKLVTIIENNINFPLASEIARVLDHPQCGPTTHMRHADRAQPGGVAFGVNTNPGTQYMGVYSAQRLFAQQQLQYHQNLVTVGKSLPGCKSDANKNLHDIYGQLSRYAKLVNERVDPLGKDKSGYSGKTGGEQDDLATVLLMLIYYPVLFYTKPQYTNDRMPYSNPISHAAVAA